MKKLTAVLSLLLCIAMVFCACAAPQAAPEVEAEATPAPTAAPTPTPAPVAESYTASAMGFGGDVTVTLTVLEGAIESLVFEGADETPGIGADAIKEFNALAAAAAGAPLADGFAIDAVSGATATSNAAAAALADVFFQATGAAPVEAVLADGIYTASTWGFSLDTMLAVTVTVEDGKIAAIVPDVANSGETDQIIATAVERMIPRILAEQSLGVDAITGATSSSNAIKAATADCLKQALLAGGVAEDQLDIALNSFYTVPSYDKTGAAPIELTTGVLVVGAGGTGSLTALESANLGADTLVIEASGKYGGTSALTCGPMVVNSPEQVKATGGVDLVDEDLLYNTWVSDARLDPNGVGAQIIDDFMKLSGYNIDWMAEQGFETFTTAITFKFPQFAVWTMYPGWNAGKVHGAGATHQYFNDIMARYTALGGETMFEMTGKELLFGDNGEVLGVKAFGYDNQEYHIYADAIVLATGGYAGSEEMLKQYTLSDEYGVYQAYGVTVNKGDGIKMAYSAGGRVPENMGMTMAHFSAPSKRIHLFDTTYNQVPTAFVINQYVLDVNTNGDRFISEPAADADAGDETARYYTIVGSKQIDDIRANGFKGNTNGMYMNPGVVPAGTPLPEIDKVIDAGVELGFIFKADTIEGLAAAITEKIGCPMTNLAATVENYNAMCAAGEDTEFGKPAEYMVPVEGEYFVAIEASPILYSTCGGIEVDTEMRVIKTDGSSIENLFAAGTDSIGVLLYDEYIDYGGVAQSWAFCSGRMAGANAAKLSLGAEDISADVADNAGITVEKINETTYSLSGTAPFAAGMTAVYGDDTDNGVNYASVLLDAPAAATEGVVTDARVLVGECDASYLVGDVLSVESGKALYAIQVNDHTNRHMGLEITVDYAGTTKTYTIYTDLLVMGEDVSAGIDVTADAVAAAAEVSKLDDINCINVGTTVSFMGEGDNSAVYALTGKLPTLPALTKALKLDAATGENYAVVALKAPAGYEAGKVEIVSSSIAPAYLDDVKLEDGSRVIVLVQKFDKGVTLPIGSVKVETVWSASGLEDKAFTYSVMFTELEYSAQLMDMGAALKELDLANKGIDITATAANTWKVDLDDEAATVNVLLTAPNLNGMYQSVVVNGEAGDPSSTMMPYTIEAAPGATVTIEAVWTTPASFWSGPVDYPVTYTFLCE